MMRFRLLVAACAVAALAVVAAVALGAGEDSLADVEPLPPAP